eukprot:1143391-Pelagomonas_calceolata.AAC.5
MPKTTAPCELHQPRGIKQASAPSGRRPADGCKGLQQGKTTASTTTKAPHDDAPHHDEASHKCTWTSEVCAQDGMAHSDLPKVNGAPDTITHASPTLRCIHTCSPSRRISLQAPAAHPAPGACCLLTHPLLVWMHPVLLQASQRTLHLSTQDQEALTSAAAADAAAAVGKEADEWADLGQGCSAAAAAVAVAAEEEEEEEKQPGCLGQNLVHQGSSPA